MSEKFSSEEANRRCATCDAVISAEQTVCVMCGTAVPPLPPATPTPDTTNTQEDATPSPPADNQQQSQVAEPEPSVLTRVVKEEVVRSVLKERPAPIFRVITAVFILFLLILGGLILRFQAPVAVAQIFQTGTPLPPTQTFVATETAVFTETPFPTLTPTITPTPAPTDTPRPPRIHVVASGETLIGLSFTYRISPESIAEANGFDLDAPVQVNQNLNIPWPTATPPLEVLTLTVNGAAVYIDPRGCEQVVVQGGDSLVGIASRFGLNFEWLAEVNRISDPELLQPGDVVCIPQVLYDGEGVFPPTPGPSPTPTATSLPAGPNLLFPADHATFADAQADAITLQWLAVQNLREDEQYMVELINSEMLEAEIWRAFTRNTYFKLPSHWRPTSEELQQYRWRVSIVRVTDYRSDGLPIYTVGGRSSNWAHFDWMGAVPTPTPLPTATPTTPPTPTTEP